MPDYSNESTFGSINWLVGLTLFFHACGYTSYLWKSRPRADREEDITPNHTVWLMFSYGTFLLTCLEWFRGATIGELSLPSFCATLSLAVMYTCYLRDKAEGIKFQLIPHGKVERLCLAISLVLTGGYLGLQFGLSQFADGTLPAQVRETLRAHAQLIVVAMIILSNTETFVSFGPTIKDMVDEPHKEHPLPWFFWTLAYITFGWYTWTQIQGPSNEGLTLEHIDFMLYPVSCAFLHGLVCLLSLRRFFRHDRQHRVHAHSYR